MKKEKHCNFCQKEINLEIEKYVLLGTYRGESVLDESYFHWDCFNKWYNSRVKEKAENFIKGATKKISGMLGGLKSMAVQSSGGGNTSNDYLDFTAEILDMKQEIPNIDLSMISDPVKYKNKKDGRKSKRKN